MTLKDQRVQHYRDLADWSAKKFISTSQNWTGFLQAAARLYKYPFAEQILIYAQYPTAAACADYRIWNNRMNRSIRSGQQGIALIDDSGCKPCLHYVFDISETRERANSKSPFFWKVTEDNAPDVMSALQKAYCVKSNNLPKLLQSISAVAVRNYWDDDTHSKDILSALDETDNKGYDEAKVKFSFEYLATFSIAYMLLYRCGFSPADYLSDKDFTENSIFFRSLPTVAALGRAVSAISEGILRSVEITLKNIQIEKRKEHGERKWADVPQGRGLPDSEHQYSGDRPGSREIRDAEENIPEESASGQIRLSPPVGAAVPPAAGSGRPGTENAGHSDAAAREGRGSNGSAETERSNEMGRPDEQLQGSGGGNHPERAYIQISLFPSEQQQIESIDQKAESEMPSASSLPKHAEIPQGPDAAGTETVPEQTRADNSQHYPPEIQPQLKNFHITDDNLGVGGAKEKYQANITAIHTLKAIEQESRSALPDEQDILSCYVGWGGIPQAFDGRNQSWTKEYKQLKELLTPEEYEAARSSTLNAHYTSPTVVKAIWEAIGNMGFTSGNVLEPACGVGNFFGLLPDSMAAAKLYGVELDSITGRIAKQLYPIADITISGFEKTNRKNFFDLAVGNVPFGSYKLADKDFDRYNFLIHDYFFAKTLDQVRPGGIIAFITSKGTMDKRSPEVRRYLAQRADLLGAIRLPNNAFKANAGTEVTSDILFLQKREHPAIAEPDWVYLGETADGIPVNSYFSEHSEMVLGRMEWADSMYGSKEETACLPEEGKDLSEQLYQAVSRISGHITRYVPEIASDTASPNISIPANPTVRNFSYTLVGNDVYYRENSVMTLQKGESGRIKGMVELQCCLHTLMDYELHDAANDAILAKQSELNRRYDSFVGQYGHINSRPNKTAFSQDSAYYLLCSLEKLDGNGKFLAKGDAFTKRTIRRQQTVDHVDTAAEALTISISEKAAVDLEFMSDLSGLSKDKLISDLKGIIFRDFGETNPSEIPKAFFNLDAVPFVTADEYLSGNVRRKLRTAKGLVEMRPDLADQIASNIQALTGVQPKDLDASEIDARLGSTWIDADYIRQFMLELLKVPPYMAESIKVHYSPLTADWYIENKPSASWYNVAARETYGTSRISAYKILEESLNLRDVKIYDTVTDSDDKQHRVLNRNETTLAQQKQQTIKNAFKDWIWREPERRQALVKQYNETFNSTRPREYDGKAITFGGMNPEIQLREHQANAIARILYGGNTLLAHVVGAGKTFEMVAAAMESKRLGLCHKSLFVVLNHLIEQWASDFLFLYPYANILVAGKKDFETQNRKRFCARIATGDYDAVIIGHSQFEKIPISTKRQEYLLQQQVEEIESGIEEVKSSRGERFTIKQMERTKKGLQARLEKLTAADRKDDVVTFEELGIDRLFVDEAHNYKNLFLFTKMQNIAGLSTSDAQKSSDMFAKCRYLDELTGNKGVIFATGTPVSNSMTEIYTMQRYLQYDTLARNGLIHFDAWASTFGETTTSIELAPEGTGYRARTRFAKFYNLPELMNMFKEVADIKTADVLHLPVPKATYKTISVPPSEFQKKMVKDLSERASEIHTGLVDPSKDNMLKITSDGRKLGLDQRIINPMLPDNPGSKVNACVNNIHRIWLSSKEKKCTQLVFCDISIPGSTAQADSASGFSNVYDDIRRKLIGRGIPENEIAFIHDAKTDEQKDKLFAKVRSGQVRVLLGSTFKMGTGTNVQDRMIALHDLDAPWRPGDLEQRSGRIVRQGNLNPEVEIYRYVTDGTFDAYLWQTLENKQRFISQIMTSKSPVRSCEDIDETVLSFAEIKALCAGNPEIKEKMDLDIEVSRLKLLRANHQSQQYHLEDQISKYFPETINSYSCSVSGYQHDIALLSKHVPPKGKFPGITIGDTFYSEKEDAGKALIALCQSYSPLSASHQAGAYRGFPMYLDFDSLNREFNVILRGQISHRAVLGNDIVGNLTRIDNALESMGTKLTALQQKLGDLQHQLDYAKQEALKPFPQEAELSQKNARLAKLNAQLSLDKPDSPDADKEKPPQSTISQKIDVAQKQAQRENNPLIYERSNYEQSL